ncbi:MAG: permease [bacterium]|nr:permease [bacterium]MDT8365096.1 permease [bacterium]
MTSTKKRDKGMLYATLIFAVLALVLLSIGYFRGEGQHITGLRAGFTILIQILPLLMLAFIVAGMVQVLIPKEVIGQWVGAESGWKGILIGTGAGALTPGGPFVSMPMVAGFFKAGAGYGTMVAYITAWSLLSVARLPIEVGILGWRFTVIRIACTWFMAPLAGFIANTFFKV